MTKERINRANYDPELQRSLIKAKKVLEDMGYWNDELQEAYDGGDHDCIIAVMAERVAELTEKVTNE